MAEPSIFISYRRDDSAGHAGRLFDRLVQRFGDDHVFRDVDDIAPGEDFTQAVHDKINACDVLIVVIGTRWLSIADAQGTPRLQNPLDLVRREISGALARNIRVIPVLVHGGRLPAAESLPEELRALVQRNAVELRDTHFNTDVALLFEQLAPSGAAPRAGALKILIGLAALGLAAGIGVQWWKSLAPDEATPAADTGEPLIASDLTPAEARAQLAAMQIEPTQEGFAQAAMRNDELAVSLFAASGLNPDVGDVNGVTPLAWAASNGNTRMARLLIDSGADPGQALPSATAPQDKPMFELLMGYEHAQDELDLALVAAGRDGSTHAIETLIDRGASLATHGGEALQRAAHELHVDAVRLLLARGVAADPATIEDRWMPLQAAASAPTTPEQSARALQILQLLLDKGADVNRRRSDAVHPTPTALLCALKARDAAAARLLIEHGADVHTRSATGVAEGEAETGRTALMWAADAGLLDVARLLIEKGANADTRAEGGANALIDATRSGDVALIDLLLEHGASTEARDKYDRTPLMMAAIAHNPAAVSRLLAADAKVEARSRATGRTALMLLASRAVSPADSRHAQALAVARLLIQAGADLDAQDREGARALDLAQQAGWPAMVELLSTPAAGEDPTEQALPS